ncbi:MAG: hypothetical protein ACD_57C00386G0005 [uncultured bacterium]|uniref:DNA polymerase III subunit delta n=1 Tax=Candidatus Curtissbacteria bacterium RIFOXYA1_FULL_41_14 TaxID=1797737 RepID=A0A1F5HGD1_9BACT|nr:MAG: hypothetical protein ACD_57C00386G0005 [uncultured bacterium]KKR58438.1 MAG: hypothetical protein UT95_C0005G0006 [Candidatus Curtissbacteria bacterium GW2011_GWB1_40_28]KKR61110.1 MAG: hypothetical protein UT99_C0002G0039 [Candidatus Curtissbacteria bacterium GW2011_GWA2_40_31]KKR61991.1 MAG: hypothetical protein UU00_C0005G0047 [Microgenomates group bacterium GW2011_GWC1_40_35]KKR66163.1 MAG: hypothetical protein UU05_C0004G0011 [Candidatus Curtissbacteria bacterium GW2011_GWA1_40_47]
MSLFQSYLIIGEASQRRIQTETLAKNLGIDLKKVSPDIFIIAPQDQSISISQVRDLKAHIFEKPVKSKYKFIIIESAHNLTVEAQNALLKILEEPPDCAIIVMEAKTRQDLLPTILSRVVIKRSQQSKAHLSSNPISYEKENLLADLETIAQVKDPTDWIDEQIQLLYWQLLENLKDENFSSAIWHLAQIINRFQKAKIMIEANVDSKFALADLIFSLKSLDYPKLNQLH